MNGSVCPSVPMSVRLSATPFWCSSHPIIMKLSGMIVIYKSDVHAKGPGKRSNVNVIEIKNPIKPFPESNSSFDSHMAMKRYTKLDVAWKRWPIVFQGHPSNVKDTRAENQRFWPKIDGFRDCNCSHKSQMAAKWCTNIEVAWGRCPVFLVFFEGVEVIRQIAKSRKPQNRQLWGFLIMTPVSIHWWPANARQKFEMAWKRYPFFSRLSIEFQGPARQNIANCDSNLVFPDCDSQIHRWLWNKAPSLKRHGRGVIYFFEVYPSLLCHSCWTHDNLNWYNPQCFIFFIEGVL